jgi:hypothetical protein
MTTSDDSFVQKKIRQCVRDASAIADCLWNTKGCQDEVTSLLEDLVKEGVTEMIAIHEAGHEVFYLRAGATVGSFESARIIYTAGIAKPFDAQRGAIRLGGYNKPEREDWCELLAKGFAAGGRCSLRLSRRKIAADGDDKIKFREMFASCFDSSDVNEESIERAWVNAQKAVETDLENPELQADIRRRAGEITGLLFPWLKTANTP